MAWQQFLQHGLATMGHKTIAQPLVGSVIVGATSPAQVKANVSAAGWKLRADNLAAVHAALGG